MFGVYRRELLARVMLRPNEKFHVRELARVTGFSPGSIHREMKAMAEVGLLLREHVGNQVLYQVNQECPIYEDLASIFRKTAGLVIVLQDAMQGIFDQIHTALIFGSMASGTQSEFSDVDVLVLSELPMVEVVKALVSAQAELGREINPVVMPKEKFAELVEKQDRFAMRVLEEPKLFLKGNENEFGKFVANRETG
jgi:predicted nucleotidyltransferase